MFSGFVGSSATVKWLQIPTTSICPASCLRLASSMRAGQSAGAQPARPRPVSIFRWTRANVVSRSSCAAVEMPRSMRASATSAHGSSGLASHARIGPGSPLARSSSASLNSATPSHSVPASRAAWAMGSRPWPYASALTIAICWLFGARARRAARLRAYAERSMRAWARGICPWYSARTRQLGAQGCAFCPGVRPSLNADQAKCARIPQTAGENAPSALGSASRPNCENVHQRITQLLPPPGGRRPAGCAFCPGVRPAPDADQVKRALTPQTAGQNAPATHATAGRTSSAMSTAVAG